MQLAKYTSVSSAFLQPGQPLCPYFEFLCHDCQVHNHQVIPYACLHNNHNIMPNALYHNCQVMPNACYNTISSQVVPNAAWLHLNQQVMPEQIFAVPQLLGYA